MIKYLILYRSPLFWVFLHVILGFASSFSPFPLVIYFYVFLFSSIYVFFKNAKTKFNLTYLIVYLVPFEILARMAQASPYIPYEIGKYLLLFLLLSGLANFKINSGIGYFLLILLLPALFYDYSNKVDFQGLVFNILGPINLCLGIIYFYKYPIVESQLMKLIVALILPLISALAFTYIRTPEFDKIEFSMNANFETTGGFGSNQVATIFGLGMFLMFVLIYNRIRISGFLLLDSFILSLFTFQGLLSFSRGGMIGGALSILIFIFFSSRSNSSFKLYQKISPKYLFVAIILISTSIWVANEISDGNLLLRYQGETEGTLSGKKTKDLNTITTSRYSNFEGDWILFNQYPLGVGAGASRFLRNSLEGVASHIEFSRLLAEHGYLGLIYFIVLSLIPFYYFRNRLKQKWTGFLIAIFFLAWYTSFHAATRNFVTPLLIGFSFVYLRTNNVEKISKAI